jgi:hypothetical protein
VTGRIIKVHTKDFDYKGYTHHASSEDPQYEIKSDKTEHVAAHKGSALHKIGGLFEAGSSLAAHRGHGKREQDDEHG